MDFVTLVCCREMFLKQYRFGVYLSVMLGFIIGHVSNYLLSLWFVFRDESEREKGWTRRAFTLFLVVGIIGAGITEFGMWIGYGCFNFNYVAVKVFMAGIVVLWNFLGRKIVVTV
jgi:putative flippase GtrA